MPLMLRIPGKGKKIAYAILGKPANMRKKGSSRKVKVYNPNELYLGPQNNDLIT